MNLYRCTNKLGTYYVVADDPTAAQKHLVEVLSGGDGYGFYDERKVKNIELVAEQITRNDAVMRPWNLTNKFLLLP